MTSKTMISNYASSQKQFRFVMDYSFWVNNKGFIHTF